MAYGVWHKQVRIISLFVLSAISNQLYAPIPLRSSDLDQTLFDRHANELGGIGDA